MLALRIRRIEFLRTRLGVQAFLERHQALLGNQKPPTVEVINLQIDAVACHPFMCPMPESARLDANNPGRCGQVVVAFAVFKLEGSIFVPSAESIRVFRVSFHRDTLPEFARKSISKIHSDTGAFISQPALIGTEPSRLATANGAAPLEGTSSGVSGGPDLESRVAGKSRFRARSGDFHNLDIWLTIPDGTYHWRNQADGFFE